jgi:hypothetical protein
MAGFKVITEDLVAYGDLCLPRSHGSAFWPVISAKPLIEFPSTANLTKIYESKHFRRSATFPSKT